MNLYTARDSNIRRTWFLFTIFFIVIIGVGWVFSQIYLSPSILFFAVFFSILMSFISYWYSDKIVLSINKAQPIERKNAPELYNIVENLAITVGLPSPRIYIIKEDAPNAFATGRDPNHAVVAVTTGLLERLSRTELEGVLSHELSHVGNRDILISTVVVVLAGFASLLADFFLRSLFWRGAFGTRDREEGQAGAIFMLIGIIFAIFAPIAATLIQLAISRNREFLADASGALLTRYPEGLALALEKISKYEKPLKVANNATAHLWISDPHGKKHYGISRFFMTHPPIGERIKRLREMNV